MLNSFRRIVAGFWGLRYHVYNRDLYKALREGRGTRENPLTIDDLQPAMKAQKRLLRHRSKVR